MAGYGKAKGEYVVGCHSFNRDQGEEGYFLISAHILLIHGHVIPLTTRLLALSGAAPVSPLLREVMRTLITEFGPELEDFDPTDRMQVYESRSRLYLAALAQSQRCFDAIHNCVIAWLHEHEAGATIIEQATRLLQLDALLCPRAGSETTLELELDYNATQVYDKLAAMELPEASSFDGSSRLMTIQHPGGVGEILFDPDGGSWLRGKLSLATQANEKIIAIA